jgi:hypothetical protein
MKLFPILILCSMLAGCAATAGPSLKYLDLTPTKVLGVITDDDTSLLGLNTRIKHLYEIDPKTGDAKLVYSSSASSPGPIEQILQSGAGASGAAGAAIATPIMGALIPTKTTTNTSVSVKTTGSK